MYLDDIPQESTGKKKHKIMSKNTETVFNKIKTQNFPQT